MRSFNDNPYATTSPHAGTQHTPCYRSGADQPPSRGDSVHKTTRPMFRAVQTFCVPWDSVTAKSRC